MNLQPVRTVTLKLIDLAISQQPYSLLKCALLTVAAAACCPVALAQTAHFGSSESIVIASGLRTNHNVAVDPSGNVYVPNTWNHQVLKETWTGSGYTQTTIGTGWQEPWGIAIDGNGSLYITDTGLNTTVKLTPSGSSYTQSTIGSGFLGPEGLAVDLSGNVYIADSQNNQLVKLTLSAGVYTKSVIVTGLNNPGGVAVDAGGNLYIADTNNYRVLLETLSGGSYTQTQMNVPGLDMPFGVTLGPAGNIYVVDTYHNKILLETPSSGGYTQSAIPTSQMYYPSGVAVDASGNVYISDSDNGRVIKETLSGVNFGSVNVGSISAPLTLNFVFDSAGKLNSKTVLTQGATGLDFADAGTGTCAVGTNYKSGDTCTVNATFTPAVSGARNGAVQISTSAGNKVATGYIFGTGVGPQVNFIPGTETTIATTGLSNPNGPAVDPSGNVYFADYSNNRVVKETLTASGYTESTIGSGFKMPGGVAVDGAGNLYVSDTGNYRVLVETLSGGSYTQSVLPTPGLSYPYGVAVDGNGNVYLVDTTNSRILKETVLGSSYVQSVIGTGLLYPYGVAVDGSGNVYIADTLNNRVVKETLSAGAYTQSVVGGGLSLPYGIAVDGNGAIFIADTWNQRITKETPVAGGYYQTTAAGGTLTHPYGVAVDGSGNIYVADTANNRIVKEDLADPPNRSFSPTNVGSVSAAQAQSLENIGNAALTFPIPATGSNPSVAANFTLSGAGSTPCPILNAGATAAGTLAAEASCQLQIAFAPTGKGSVTGSLVVTDNALNAPAPSYAAQSFTLKGSGIQTQTAPTITWAAPAAIVYGTPLSAGQLNATANVAGTFSYSPASGSILSAGTQTLSVTFTPTDTTDYTTATASVSLAVNQAKPAITWGAPANITYGTALGATQLNAASTVAGTFVYSPASGAVLTAGSQTLSVNFTPTDAVDYTTATSTVTLSVNQAAQTIAFAPPASPVTYGTGPIALSATGGASGLPVTFSVSGPATLNGSTLSVTGTGAVVVTASQAGNSNYSAAKAVAQTIVVNQAASAIVLAAATLTPTQTLADLLTATVTGAGTIGGTVVFSSGATTLCSAALTAGSATCSFAPATIGAVPVTAQYQGDANHQGSLATLNLTVSPLYDAAVSLQLGSNPVVYPGATNVTVCVAKATRVHASGTAGIYDGTTLLTTLTLGGDGCAYWYISPGLNVGDHLLSASYSGDKNNAAGSSAPAVLTVSPVPVNLVAVASNNPIPYGISYRAIVTASSNVGSPLGFITYSLDGGAAIPMALSSGNAKLTIGGVPVGNHQVVVSYAQQTNFAAATPQTLFFTVTVAPVSVALTPSTSYGPAGSAISFTAAITSKTGGTPNAIGTVSFTDGATTLGSAAVNGSGQAVFTTSSLSAGTHTITASFNGAGQYGNGSASTAVTVAQAASATKLTAGSTSLTLGQTAQLTATVTGVNPTGAVVFASSGTTLCMSTLNAGTATCSFIPTAAGGMPVTAKYQGDTNNLPSGAYLNLAISSPVDAAITLQFANTTLTYPGQTNVTVCVASLKKSAVTGTVQIFDGPALLTTQALSGNGCAYWYIAPALAVGSHSFTAAFSGDKNNPAGVSAATTITVNPIPVSMAISSGNTSIPYGVNFYRTVTVSSNAGSPTGSIAYSLDGGAAVAAPLSAGNAKFSIALTGAGNHQVVVSYAAQGNFAAASPQTVGFTVNQAAVSVTLTPAFASVQPGVSLSLLAAVTSTSAGAPNGDGTVSFYDGTALLGVVPVNAQGQAVYAASGLLNGTHTITATYGQAANFGSGSAISKVWIGN